MDDSFLTEKLDFVKSFHEATFNKDNEQLIVPYLEPTDAMSNTDFAKVTINSNYDLITWGQLEPTIISDVIPTIKEFNIETGCIALTYYIKAKTDSGEERYLINEFYRVRFTSNRIYMLYFERTMNAVYDSVLTSLSKNELKIGITTDTRLNMMASSDQKKICFEYNSALYYYDIEKKDRKSVV